MKKAFVPMDKSLYLCFDLSYSVLFVVCFCGFGKDQIKYHVDGKQNRRQIISGAVRAYGIVDQIGQGRGEKACGVNDGNEHARVLTLRLVSEQGEGKEWNGDGNQGKGDAVKHYRKTS